MWKPFLGYLIRLTTKPARSSGIAIATVFAVAVLIAGKGAASIVNNFDSEGESLDRGHADGSRWRTPGQKNDLPIMALLWFAGDTEALEFSLAPGWGTFKTTKLLEKTRREQRLSPETISSLSALLRRLRERSYTPKAPYTGVSRAEWVRVSWQEGSNWISRTYSRKSPPEELLELFHLLELRFEFICPGIPQSAPANVKELPGPWSGFATATCDPGLLLVGNGKVILLDAYQCGHPRYFPAPAGLTNAPLLAVTPDAERMVLLTGKSMLLCEVRSGKELWRHALDPSTYLRSAIPDATGSRIVARDNKSLFLYDTRTNVEPRRLTTLADSISNVAWSTDGRWLAFASDDNVKLWDSLNDTISVLSTNRWPLCIAFSPDAKQLAVANQTQVAIEIFDIAERQLAFTIPSLVEMRGLTYIPKRMAWSPAGTFLALELDPYGCLLFDTQRRVPIAYDFASLQSPVAFDKKGTSMIAITMRRDILCWKMPAPSR